MPNYHVHKKKKQHKKKHDANNNAGASPDSRSSIGDESQFDEDELDKPYVIKHSDIMGRYLVAAQDLKAGTLLMEESALLVGPCADTEPVCLGCYVELPKNSKIFKCRGCGWPLCGSECPGFKTTLGHSSWECSLLREKRVADYLDKTEKISIRQMYEVILPLRCLLLKSNDKGRWEKLMTMEAHNDIRREIPKLWNRNQNVVVKMIRSTWGIKQFTEDDIHTVCGILEVNSFEIGQNGSKARALYPSAFLIAHECTPNTTHTDHPITHNLTIRATKSIKKNEMFSLSYAYTLQGTLKRREHLQTCKFFWCVCKRCADPTELGTYASAMRCPKCRDGIILSTDPLNQDADWKCNSCNYYLPGSSMLLIVDRIFLELDAIDCNNIKKYEEFLEKYRNVLHKNHYLCLSAKHSLCQLYGRIDGYLIQQLAIEDLKRKEEYCRDFLEIASILEPGLSRLRGCTMYELHAPLMVQATREFEGKKITCDALKKRLKEVIKLLRDSEEILSIEPEGSSEHTMALAAADALMRLGTV